MKNLLLLLGTLVGTALLIAGVMTIGTDPRAGGLYLLGGVLGFVVALGPGRRLRGAKHPE